MKAQRKLFLIAIAVTLAVAVYPQWAKSEKSPAASKLFLGRWDLTLKGPDREYASWIEISDDGGQLKAQMVGRGGNARPLPRVELTAGHLTFVSPKEEENSKTDLVFKGTLVGGHLSGTLNGPDGTEWTWKGDRAPTLGRTGTPRWGKSIPLFNGKDLTGWHVSKHRPSASWKIEDEILVSPGNGPELISTAKFSDFRLHVEFNCAKGANSGVYLRGRYEVQIEDDPEPEGPTMRTGGVYGFLAASPEQPRRPGEWQTYDITLIGREVTVVQNGETIIDKQEIPGITGGALDSHEGLPGPIYLQGTETGHVAFRNIVITPAKK